MEKKYVIVKKLNNCYSATSISSMVYTVCSIQYNNLPLIRRSWSFVYVWFKLQTEEVQIEKLIGYESTKSIISIYYQLIHFFSFYYYRGY